MITYKFPAASYPISTHHGLGTIIIENSHLKISHVTFIDRNQAITSNTKVWLTPFNRSLTKISNSILWQININVIIATSMHFGKMNNITHFGKQINPNAKI